MLNYPYTGQLYNPMQPNNFNYMSMFQQPMKIPRFKGEEGARAYQMPNGSEVLGFDMDEPIIWLVQTDDAGVKTVDALDVMKRQAVESTTMKSLENRIRKLEEAFNRESAAVNVEFTEEG